MAFKLASLFVEIGAVNTTGKSFTSISKSLNGLYWQFERLRRAAQKTFIIMGGLVTGVAYKFGQFESAMARLKGVSEATDAEFAAMDSRIRELAETSIFGATTVANAMTEFALQGFSAREAYEAIPHVLRLSQAGMIDLEKGTRIATGIMRGMGIEVENLGELVDILATTAAKSSTDIIDLGESFKAFGPLALNTRASIQDVASTFAILSTTAIRGQAAGTALRNIYLRLLAPTKAVQRSLDELKVSITDSSGKMKPFADILDELNAAMANMSDEARNWHITQLAGLRAVTSLTVAVLKGGNAVRSFSKELANSGEFAKNLADLQNRTLTASFQKMVNRIEVLAITVGEILRPVFAAVITIVDGVIASFKTLTPELQKMIAEGLVLSAAIGGIVSVLGVLGVIIVSLATPVGIAVVALATITTGLIQFGLEGDNLGEKLIDLKNRMSAFIEENQEGFITFFTMILGGYATLETAVRNFGTQFEATLAGATYLVEKFAVDVAHFFINVLPKALKYFFEAFGGNVEHFFAVVIPAYLDFFFRNWQDILLDIINATDQAFRNLGSNLKTFFTSLWDFIKGGFSGSFDFVWKDMLDGFKRTTTEMAEIAPRMVGPVEQALKDAYDKSWDRAETDSEKRNRQLAEHLSKQLKETADRRLEELLGVFFNRNAFKKAATLPPGAAKPKVDPRGVGTEGRVSGKGSLTFVGIDELARKIQLAAVGGNVPEQQLAEQKKGNEILKNVNAGIKDVGKKLEKGVGLRITR